MKIFNSLSGKKEEFKPIEDGKVKMYVCGPTVYDLGHVGHARSAVAFDVARKYLEYKGYEVKFVSNFTDIDDKMINRAHEEGVSVEELAERIIPEYEKDYAALGVMRPDVAPKATEYVEAIVKSIEELEAKGYVYVIEGDGVYFEVEKFAEYGKLSGQSLEDLQMGARVDVNDKKKAPYDFALWKFKKEGEPFWDSPWGEGRPGWHIECSAMVEAIFGGGIDIHGGGVDLKFPHHECEIAQHEGACGGQFAKIWMHNGFIRIDDEKMSKSLGNFFTIRDVLKKFDPMVVRFFLIQKGYRAPIDFSDEALEQARNGLERVREFLRRIDAVKGDGGGVDEKIEDLVEAARKKFEVGMDDDFETPEALAALFELIRSMNSVMAERALTVAEVGVVRELLEGFDEVLGVVHLEEEVFEDDVLDLVSERQKAREGKNWEKSDEIRDRLAKEFGVLIEDTPDGQKFRKM